VRRAFSERALNESAYGSCVPFSSPSARARSALHCCGVVLVAVTSLRAARWFTRGAMAADLALAVLLAPTGLILLSSVSLYQFLAFWRRTLRRPTTRARAGPQLMPRHRHPRTQCLLQLPTLAVALRCSRQCSLVCHTLCAVASSGLVLTI
jgi:hypothetical protein